MSQVTPTQFTPFNDNEDNGNQTIQIEDERITNMTEVAKLNTSLLQAEADCAAIHAKQEVTDFLEKTKASLESFIEVISVNNFTRDNNIRPDEDGIPILHSYLEMKEFADRVLNGLKIGNQENEAEEDFDHFATELVVREKQPSSTILNPNILNEKRRSIYESLKRF